MSKKKALLGKNFVQPYYLTRHCRRSLPGTTGFRLRRGRRKQRSCTRPARAQEKSALVSYLRLKAAGACVMVTENFWMSSCRSMSSSALIAGCWLKRVQTFSTISRCARRLWSAAASTLGSLTLDAADRTSEASSSSCTNSSTCWAWAGSRLWARWAAKAPDRPLVPATAQPPRAPPC